MVTPNDLPIVRFLNVAMLLCKSNAVAAVVNRRSDWLLDINSPANTLIVPCNSNDLPVKSKRAALRFIVNGPVTIVVPPMATLPLFASDPALRVPWVITDAPVPTVKVVAVRLSAMVKALTILFVLLNCSLSNVEAASKSRV